MGPLVGAAAFHSIRDFVMPLTDHWRLLLGLAIIAIVLVFPRGLVGAGLELRARSGAKGRPRPAGRRAAA
jgi:branched-chain amino acid transport system permease protein